MSRQVGIASLIWGGAILLSRVIGLVREAVIGRVLGGGSEADVYWAAFLVPDFLNYLLAGGALSLVFIPIFNGYLARDEVDKGWEAFSNIANFLLLLLAILLPLTWWAMPWLATLVAPGFDEAQTARLVTLCRIILPAQAFHLIGGLLSSALQAQDKHMLPALAPLLYTGSIVVGGLIGASAEGFAWGVVVGSVLGPFGLPLLGNLRVGMHWRPLLAPRHPDLKLYLWRMLPIMMGFSVVMMDDLVLRNQASLLEEGAISTLTYGKTLMKVPMGVFGLATGAAAYPTLTRLIGAGKHDEGFDLLAGAIKRMLVLAFGAQVALTCAGAEIAQVIYGDRLPAEQHADIGLALAIFGIGLWAWASQNLVARGFYAVGNTWLPTVVGTGALALMLPVYIGLRGQLGLLGLATASSLTISAYVLVLVLLLRRKYGGRADGYGAFALRAVPAVVLGIGAGMTLEQVIDLPHPLLQGGVLGVVGGAVYLVTILALRLPEATEVVGMVRRRILRRRGTR